MLVLTAEQADGLAKTMVARSRGLHLRVVFGAVQAAAFGPFAGWTAAAVWFAAYGVLQFIEVVAARRAAGAPFPPRAAIALLTANSVVYGAMALLAMFTGGPWGMAGGVLFLSGAVINTCITSQRSPIAFIASITPFALYLAAAALLGWSLSGRPAVAISAGVIVATVLYTSIMLWKSAAEGLLRLSRARAEAERRRAEAEAAVQAKSAFVAMVSHELRTPISAILAGAEALQRGGADPAAIHAQAGLIGESGKMMRALLNDLLDLSKMEAGRMRIETITFDLPALVAETTAFWSAEAAKKGLSLRLREDGLLPGMVAGDPTRLRQILNNLLSNALKFTEAGGVTVALEAPPCDDGEPGWRLRVAVSDTGPGMGPEQMARLFTPFDQTRDSTARTHGGTGLGLSISRQLAQLMGGDLRANSAPGEGSTFVLDVRLGPGEAAAAPAAELGDVEVLIADDHEMNRKAVALMLEPLGVKLTSAPSGEAALELAAARRFDVILMDVHMPGMGGHEACRRLRATPGPNRQTPVIACTGDAEAADWEACRAAGMTSRVVKPIDPAALHLALAEALDTAPAARQIA